MNLYKYVTLILIEIQHVIPFGDYMFLIETILENIRKSKHLELCIAFTFVWKWSGVK